MINGEIMGTVAIVLIVIGIICVIISIILGITDNKEQADNASYVSDYDSAKQVSQVSKAIDDIIEKKMQDIEEKTEASLDKISNTKILEMNEYADNVLKEINRNHNEVMFMYDIRLFQIDTPVRFDIITVVGDDGNFKVEHIEEAFYPPLY